MLIYDPPSGWKYGFPKEYKPLSVDEPIEVTLERDGYPKALIVQGMGKWCRFWSKTEDENEKADSSGDTPV